ncbi:MAG: PilN domain-containing protein [Polyangiaceae bacterium]
MIRINLLPQKRAAGRGAGAEASQTWLLGVVGVLLLQIIGLWIFHSWKGDELTAQNQKNNEVQNKISDIKAIVANHQEVKDALAVLRKREDAIAKLQAARSGPTAILLELSRVLTIGRGPTVDADRLQALKKDNPLAVFSPTWDTRRVWLTAYNESDRTVRLEGFARDGNDVSELAQRLRLSVYFYDVAILPGKKEQDKDTKLELIKFALQMKVRY